MELVLKLAGSNGCGMTLPFEAVAQLVNVKRGSWVSRSPWDDSVIARGMSLRDTVRSTIEAIWL